MSQQLKIFLLKPKIKKNEFREIIIWSKDEGTARKNAHNTSIAAPLGTSEPITIDELTFYENPVNATCVEVHVRIDKENEKIYFECNNKHYELSENNSEEV
jgi:hypothetical protein